MRSIREYEKLCLEFDLTDHLDSRISILRNDHPEGEKAVIQWAERFEKLLQYETYPTVHPIGRETFSLYAEYPSGVFEYAVEIDLATSLIKKENMTPVTLPVSEVIHAVDQENINQDLSNVRTNHKNPVMLLQSEILTDGRLYCINGNHRINEAYKSQQTDIDVYVFRENEFIPFFYNDLSRAMYELEIEIRRF